MRTSLVSSVVLRTSLASSVVLDLESGTQNHLLTERGAVDDSLASVDAALGSVRMHSF